MIDGLTLIVVVYGDPTTKSVPEVLEIVVVTEVSVLPTYPE